MFNIKENSDAAWPELSHEHEFNYGKVASGVQRSTTKHCFCVLA